MAGPMFLMNQGRTFDIEPCDLSRRCFHMPSDFRIRSPHLTALEHLEWRRIHPRSQMRTESSEFPAPVIPALAAAEASPS